jgi:hypothetical protein
MAKAAAKKVGGAKAPSPSGHSRFGASGADRWIECPGSIQAQEPFPNETSIHSAEGTAGHEVAAMCLEDGNDAESFIGRALAVKGWPERIEITEEIAEAVQVYLDTIRADKEKHGGKLLIERNFHLNFLDDEFWGTGDCGCFGNDNVIRIYDLKLGKGKVVEVADDRGPNRQLCYYALGVISTLPKTLQGLIKEVELTVVQPRRPHKDGPVRRVRVSPEQLLDYCQDLVDAAKLARSANPPRKAGDHCVFCRAAGVCPTLREKALDAAQADFDDDGVPTIGHNGGPQFVEEMTNEELGRLLDVSDLIEHWIGAVRVRAETIANGGGHIPGYKLVPKRATKRWKGDETSVMSSLLFDFGLDESSIMVQKLKSPAQIEKLFGKSPHKAAVAELYEKVSSGNKLAKVDDPREEAKTTAQSDFDD